MLTAYDAPSAEIARGAGADLILVGDSLAMTVLGYPNTGSVSMDEMIHHAKAARRGAPDAILIGDLPLKGVEKGPSQALQSARRFVEEAGCDAVKLEWRDDAAEAALKIFNSGIPVMGHVGLTPQRVHSSQDFRVHGARASEAARIAAAARELEACGAFAVVLECVPWPVGKAITAALKVPTIGIGAGPYCDGQVLVFSDVTGIFKKFTPRFVKRFADARAPMEKAAKKFVREVRAGKFPSKKHSYEMKAEERKAFERWA